MRNPSRLHDEIAVDALTQIEAYARRAIAANGFGDASVGPTEQPLRLPSVQLYHCARAHRSRQLARIVGTTLRAVAAMARRMYVGWQRSRQAGATYVALHELDARTLRDLGFDRSEILSVAAEVAGNADSTRVRSVQARHGLPG
jgi:uncharacterized protein YjiS (DUF1127 family)